MTIAVVWPAGRVLPCPAMARPDILAAVDLGSNSFHLLIGRIAGGQVYPLDTLREQVQLGAGLTQDKRLDRASQSRALDSTFKLAPSDVSVAMIDPAPSIRIARMLAANISSTRVNP